VTTALVSLTNLEDLKSINKKKILTTKEVLVNPSALHHRQHLFYHSLKKLK